MLRSELKEVIFNHDLSLQIPLSVPVVYLTTE